MSTVYYPCGIRRIVAVLLVILSASAIAAKNVKHADMTVSVDIPIPTCSVNINNKSNEMVRLGNLTPGMKGFWLPDLTVNVNCNISTQSHRVFMMSKTNHHENNRLFLNQKQNSTGPDVILQFRDAADKALFFVADEFAGTPVFEGKESKDYLVKIFVEDLPPDIQMGNVEGTVTFKVVWD